MPLDRESLEAALHKGNVNACLALFEKADERARQAVAPVAIAWYKQQTKNFFIEEGPGRFTRNPLIDAAEAALFAACSLSQLRELGWRAAPTDEAITHQILAARRPKWIDEWVDMVLEGNPCNWVLARRLWREDLCRKPAHDNYWLGMLDRHSSLLGRFGKVSKALLAHPDLLDEVWRLFEIEGGGEFSLAGRDKYSAAENTWETGLVELAAKGKLSRARLLDASLDVLDRDFAQFRAGWFSRFHEALAPTLDERAERAPRYLHLLASKIPPTVSFALNALTLLDKAGRLPARTVVEHLGSVLLARSKGTVQSALKLLDRAAQTDPSLKTQAAIVAAGALGHENAEVQGAALKVMQQHGDSHNKELVALLRKHAANMAASQKPRLEAWLGDSDTKDTGVQKAEARGQKSKVRGQDQEVKTLLDAARSVDGTLRQLAGIDIAVKAVEAGSAHVPALEFDGTEFPRLHADQVIEPINDLDELIDRFAAVVEDAGDPDEIERVLDGVSRLCAERPDDFARRTGPLTKRAQTLLKRGAASPAFELCGLILTWTEGADVQADERVAERSKTVVHFLVRRVHALGGRVQKRQAGLLLAAPTHQGCWIDPVVLVERVAGLDTEPDRFDVVQALLRLAPDHRAEALRKASKLQGELGNALRHALGVKEVTVGPTASLWIAAARARLPFSDDSAVEACHPGMGPDGGRAARVVPQTKKHVSTYNDRRYETLYLQLEREPAIPRKIELDCPTMLLHGGVGPEFWEDVLGHWTPAAIRWAGSVWPLGRDAWFAAGVHLIAGNLDWSEADWGNRTYLEPLLDPDVPMKPMALLLLLLGLAAKEPGEHGLATDALIAAIDDGRLDGSKLGAAMASLLHTGLVKSARWAKTLTEAARMSPLHETVVARALQHTLQGDPKKAPKDVQTLLALLKELLIALGEGIALPETKKYLEGIKASGKTGKLARELLGLESRLDPERVQRAATRALARRVQRAQRWAAK